MKGKFINQYELFKMQSDESIKDIFTHFIDITNNLKSLGKTYSNKEIVRKIIMCLPKNNWGPGVTTIKQAQDFKKLKLGDRLRKLLKHQIHLKEDEGESSRKGIALKAIKEYCTSDNKKIHWLHSDWLFETLTKWAKENFQSTRIQPRRMYIKKKWKILPS